jgi:hypothetical protein
MRAHLLVWPARWLPWNEIARRVVDAVSEPNRRVSDGGLTTDKET